MPTATPLI